MMLPRFWSWGSVIAVRAPLAKPLRTVAVADDARSANREAAKATEHGESAKRHATDSVRSAGRRPCENRRSFWCSVGPYGLPALVVNDQSRRNREDPPSALSNAGAQVRIAPIDEVVSSQSLMFSRTCDEPTEPRATTNRSRRARSRPVLPHQVAPGKRISGKEHGQNSRRPNRHSTRSVALALCVESHVGAAASLPRRQRPDCLEKRDQPIQRAG